MPTELDVYKFYGCRCHPDTIRRMDYSEYPQDFDFWNHIDSKELSNLLVSLPIDACYVLRGIMNVLAHSPLFNRGRKIVETSDAIELRKAQKGYIWHCDTQEEEQSWRVQIKIDIAAFPEIAACLAEKESLQERDILVGFCDKQYITLTFRLKKI